MTIRNIALVLLALVFLIAAVSADANYTPVFTNIDQVHVNQSYKIYDQNATPFAAWLFEVVIGFILFFASLYASTRPEMGEIDGLMSAMSCLPLFVAAFESTAIEMVTGYGVAATTISNVQYYVMLENHTIYHFDIAGVVLWIFSMISTLNTIRIVINHRKFNQMFKNEGAT